MPMHYINISFCNFTIKKVENDKLAVIMHAKDALLSCTHLKTSTISKLIQIQIQIFTAVAYTG